jgi:hypothetical protein
VLALPTEDPEVVQAREDSWNDYYKPRSPAAQHLVNECVRATLLSDRVHAAYSTALTKQVRDAEENWDRTRDDEIEALKKRLRSDPAEAVRLLKRTSDGCVYLMARWECLDEQLAERGRWTAPERDEAIRLLGHDPDAETLQTCPEAWLTRLYSLTCHSNPGDRPVDWLFDPKRLPDAFRGVYSPDYLPDRATSLKALRAMINDQIEPIREEAERLSADRDEPDRAEAVNRALVIQDAPTARLFLRYQSEARTSFHKAYAELVKTLERDKAEGAAPSGPAEETAVSPNEPEPGFAAVPDSPNEPGRAETFADFTVPVSDFGGGVVPVLSFVTAAS